MKIIDLRAVPLVRPRAVPLWSATHAHSGRGDGVDGSRACVVVQVVLDDGTVGVGEASSRVETANAVCAVVTDDLRDLLVGQDPRQVTTHWRRMYQANIAHGRRGLILDAISGVDIALWDLAGKLHGTSIANLLGAGRRSVPVYASGGWYQAGKDLGDVREEFAGFAARGFVAAKLKIGGDRLPTARARIDADLARIEAARSGLGVGRMLALDANRSYDLKSALALCRELEGANIWFLEEPVPPDEIAISGRLAQATTVPIAGFETMQTRYEYRTMLLAGAIDIAQPDATWCGGITELANIAALSSSFGVQTVPHSFGSPLSFAANVQAAAGIVHASFVEYDVTSGPFDEGLITRPVIAVNGEVPIPDRPGLGVELDPEVAKELGLVTS